MKTALVRIGNSRGIRIPKPLIEQCGLGETVELRVTNDCLMVYPDRAPRQWWAEAFRAAEHSASDELLLEISPANDFDDKDWQW